MKKISLLVLVCMLLCFVFASCGLIGGNKTCEHVDANNDGVCDNCEEKVGENTPNPDPDPEPDPDPKPDPDPDPTPVTYTVSVTADANVTLSNSTITVNEGTDATFTATVSDKYVVFADGAEVVGNPVVENGNKVYTYKVAAVSANASVTLTTQQVVFAEVVAEGTGSFTGIAPWNATAGTITFDVPAAGTYYVVSTDDENVEFGAEDVESIWKCTTPYEFTVDAAGSVTLTTKYYSYMEIDSVEFNYKVFAVDPIVLPQKSDVNVVLPSYITMNVKIEAPATPGLYWVGSDVADLAWNDMLGAGFFASVEEGDEYIEFTLKSYDTTDSTFEFGYNVTVPASVVIVEGDNNIDVLLGHYTKVTFTATKNGAYLLKTTANDSFFYYWSAADNMMFGSYSTTYVTDVLSAGDTVEYYVKNSYAEEDLVEVVNLSYLGYELVSGETNTVPATADGTPVFIANVENYTDYTYMITAGENAKLGFIDGDGNVVYVDAKEILIADGEILNFVVATVDGTDADVEVNVELLVYEVDMIVGDNTFDLLPGKVYTVNVSGLAYFAEYYFVFDSEKVTILLNGEPVSPNTTYTWFFDSVTIALLGDTAESVTVTIDCPEASSNTLVLGENSVYVTIENFWASEVESVFTADEAGTYTISAADGEENAVLIVEGAYGFEMVDLPYEFTLAEGESITLIISSAADVMNETEDYVDVVITKNAAEGGLVLGENSIYVTIENNFAGNVEATFTATEAGTYTINAADGEENAVVIIETLNSSEMVDLPYEFTLAEGESITLIISSAADVMSETEDYVDLVIAKI